MNELKELFFEFLKEISENLTGAVNMGLNSAAGFHDRLDWLLAFILINFSSYTAMREDQHYAPQAAAWKKKMAEMEKEKLVEEKEGEIIVAEEEEVGEEVDGEPDAEADAALSGGASAVMAILGLSLPVTVEVSVTPEAFALLSTDYEGTPEEFENILLGSTSSPITFSIRTIFSDTAIDSFTLDSLLVPIFGGGLSYSFSGGSLPSGFSSSDSNTLVDAGRSGSNALGFLSLGTLTTLTVDVMQGGQMVGSGPLEFLNYRLDLDATNGINNAGRELNSGSDVGLVTTDTFSASNPNVHVHNASAVDLQAIGQVMNWDVLSGLFTLTVGSPGSTSAAQFNAGTLDVTSDASGSTPFNIRLSTNTTTAEAAMTQFGALLLNDLANTWVGEPSDSISVVFGLGGNDRLVGDGEGDVTSVAGDDILIGGDGDDTIIVDNPGGFAFSLDDAGSNIVFGGRGTDTITGIGHAAGGVPGAMTHYLYDVTSGFDNGTDTILSFSTGAIVGAGEFVFFNAGGTTITDLVSVINFSRVSSEHVFEIDNTAGGTVTIDGSTGVEAYTLNINAGGSDVSYTARLGDASAGVVFTASTAADEIFSNFGAVAFFSFEPSSMGTDVIYSFIAEPGALELDYTAAGLALPASATAATNVVDSGVDIDGDGINEAMVQVRNSTDTATLGNIIFEGVDYTVDGELTLAAYSAIADTSISIV